ncbi:MAG: class E sortase [Acidimicrobiales bacterium]|nr:class E sortase [Acidimicrobiales bacterium]
MLKRVALALIGVGLLLLSFVAYQLWGTALYEHNAQNQLRHELAGKLHSSLTTPTTTASTAPGQTTTTGSPAALVNQVAPPAPDPKVGTPIGLLSIPRLGMQGVAIVEGTDEAQLQEGPGHYAGTPLPGEAGNVAIAGHRTTYGAPFYDLNTLQPGDPIDIQTAQGLFGYQVVTSHVVAPSNVTVLAQTSTPELTLTTCNPRYSAATRLVVVATLKTSITSASFPTTTTLPGTSTSSSPPTTTPVLAGGAEGAQGSGGLGGVSTRGEVGEAGLWGALTVISGILGVIGWRRGRRPWSWVVLSMGVPLTVAALLVCYQHISLALPQSF